MITVPQFFVIIAFFMVFVWMIIDQYFPDYRNYLLGLWQFYILKRFDRPLHFKLYADLEQQLKVLEKSGKRKYEQKLVRMIMDQAGRYKARMTGKHKNKIRCKIYKGGKKYTTFR